MTQNIPLLFASGSHYEVWKYVGSNFKSRIEDFIGTQVNLKKWEEFTATEGGRLFVEKFRRTMEEDFPVYAEELRGLADGCHIPYQKLLMLNLSAELSSELELTNADLGCSDIIINNEEEGIVWAHNEDQIPTAADYDFLLCARFDSCTDNRGRHYPEETILTHIVAGCLAGRTFSINNHGFGFTMNYVKVPKPVNRQRPVPRIIVLRHLLSALDITDADRRMKECTGVSYCGFNINIGQVGVDKVWSFEAGPHPITGRIQTSIKEITREDTSYGHFNCFQHLDVPYTKFTNSERRTTRFEQIPKAKTLEDAINILGDTADPEYPMYQSGKPPSEFKTTCTVIFNMQKKTITLYKKNPTLSKPVAIIPMDIVK